MGLSFSFNKHHLVKKYKKRVLQYSRKVSWDFFRDELDEEFLDGEFWVHRQSLVEIKTRLTKEIFKPFDHTVESFQQYLDL